MVVVVVVRRVGGEKKLKKSQISPETRDLINRN